MKIVLWCVVCVSHWFLVSSLPAKWIEMTYKFDNTTIYWPGTTRFKHTLVFQGQKSEFYYSNYDISASEHGGTHLDAPIHFAAGKMTTDEIPLETLIGDAIVINMTDKAAEDPDAQLTVNDLTAWEEQHGRIPDNVILLLLTGWGRYWPNAQQYLGTTGGNMSVLHFPGLDPNAAQWIVDNRKIKLFGLDTASADYGLSKTFKSHQILFTRNIPVLENLANLDKLPVKGAMVFAAPQLITGGSGGPARVFATITKPEPSAGFAVSVNAALLAVLPGVALIFRFALSHLL